MELPQARSFGTEARKPTHDFLSLYSHSNAPQDPRPPSQGSYLKTHDFLQPLERVEKKASTKEEASDEISSVVQKPPPPAPFPQPCVEHILPGGIGTYSISHISYFSNHRVPKPEASLFTVSQACEASSDRNEENSNCSSYTGSGFTLWEESAVQKGKTGKENDVGEKPVIAECGAKAGQWSMTERASQSFVKNNQNSFNSITSTQKTGQKNQSFIDMIKSAKDCSQDEELDNEDAFIFKKGSSNTQRGELRVTVDGKSSDQRPNTPRSKHSATEQRRRSKINDRFQMLRALIPHSDQKRDKASFLLEVIEYIQFLQEKVQKHEGSYQVWNQEKEKLTPWRNNQRPSESYDDQSRVINSGSGPSSILLFPSKMEEENFSISPTVTGGTKNVAGTSSATTLKAMNQHPGITNKAMPIPNSSQPNFFNPGQSGGPGRLASQLTHRLISDAENTIYKPLGLSQTHSSATGVTAASDKLKEKDLTIESGAISLSSVYSKGLLDSLTQALKNSGVDLSQASISVQIELGKQANIRPIGATSGVKDEVASSNQGMKRSRVCSVEETDLAVKKLKTTRS